MEGDEWQGDHILYERGGRVSQGCDGVVLVPRVLELVRRRTPVEVNEDIGLGGNLPTRYQGGGVWREGGEALREACWGSVYLWRRADDP